MSIQTAANISFPLSIIFRSSLDSGVVPIDWKRADVWANDAKLSRHKSTCQGSLSLQDDINKLTDWTYEWLILINYE